MSLSFDWVTALGGAAAGYYAKGLVEDTKAEAKQAVSDTAAAAAVAAAQAVVNGQPSGQQSGQGPKAGH